MKKIFYTLLCLVGFCFIANNLQAQCPVGQTEVSIEIVTVSFAGEMGWELIETGSGTVVACQPGGTYPTNGVTVTEGPYCLTDGLTYEFFGYDTFGDDWNGGYANIIITEDGTVNGCGTQDGCALLLNGGEDVDVEPDVNANTTCETGTNAEFSFVIPATACDASTVIATGCTDPAGLNYNACAITDDGSCIIPPSNDDCANAIALTVEADLNCNAPVNGTTVGTSQSLPACTGTANDDIWYSFVATGAAHVILVNNIAGSTDIAIEVFDACGGASLLCQDFPDDSATLAGLTPGNTYVIRIHSWGGGNDTTFGICVGTPPPPPANNDCATAIPFAVQATGSCPVGETPVDFFSALPSGLVPSCSFNASDFDVFFDVTVPASGYLQVFTSSAGFNTPGVAIYDACGGAELYCNTFINNDPIPLVAFAGQNVIVQFYDNETYTFNACIQDPPPPPANDDFTNAEVLCGGIATTANNDQATTDPNDATLVPPPNCYGSLENTIWYSFESDASGADITIDFTPTANCGGTLQIHILSDLDGDGVFFTEACDNSTGPPTTLTFTPVANTQYYIFIDGNGGQICEFTIQDNGGVASCCGPEYTINTYCVPGDEANFYADFDLTNLGTDPAGYTVNGTAVTTVGTTTFGPFANGADALNIIGIGDPSCVITENIANDCACAPGSITVMNNDTTVNAGSSVGLIADAGLVIPGGFLGYFVDAQTTGCSVSPTDPTTVTAIGAIGDDASAPVTIPFTFPFFDNTYTNLLISSNGYITFGTDGTDLSEDPIPSTNTPDDIIALFWDDLALNGAGGVAYFPEVIGGVNCLVITFSAVEHLGGGETVTGQIIICEDGAITITCLNCQADNGTDTATQGIENSDGTQGYFDPVLTNGQFTAGGALTNCVTFLPNNSVPSTCDTIGWVTDLNDIPGSLVTADFNALTVNPTVTTTYYAVVECNYFEGPTLTCVDEMTITVTGNASAMAGISDPCDCVDIRNVDVLDQDMLPGTDGSYDFFYEEITLTTMPATPGITDWTLTATSTGTIYDATGTVAPATIIDNGDGTYTVSFYLASGDTYTIGYTSAAAGVTTADVSGGGCTPCETIPTLSEWGLIALALMLMSYGSIVMAGTGSLAGANNMQLPINNFQLPFNAAILRKAFMFTALLAVIGYTMSIVMFGAIFFSDIIGVAIAGPIFAYLTHLLYLIEKNK